MADPQIYTPGYSFSGFQASNPSKPLPAPRLDDELAKISTSVTQTINALKDIRRSDGKLTNGIITFEALESSLNALIAAVPGLAVSAAASAQLAGDYMNQAANWANRSQDAANAAQASAQRALENATGLVLATQAQAEAGVLNDKGMTPLRTRQAVDDVLLILRGSGGDDTARLNAAIAKVLASGRKGNIKIVGTVGVTATITNFPQNVGLDCLDGNILALPGFAADAPVLKFGDRVTQTRWGGGSPRIHVDCGGQHLIGVQFSYPWFGGNVIDAVWVDKCSYIPMHVDRGYGLFVNSYRLKAPTLESGDSVNAGTDSIGMLVDTGDCNFGPGTVYGCFVGIKNMAANNHFTGAHPFGVYQKAGVPQSCPMGVGIWNEGEGSVFDACISDSPSLVNYAQAASTVNGGYGFLNTGAGFKSRFNNCTTFIPDRSVFGETLPVARIVGVQLLQPANVIGHETVDQAGALLSRYGGSQQTNSAILSRADFSIPTQGSATPSSLSFSQPNDRTIIIKSDFNGLAKETRLERYRFGNSATQTFLGTVLGLDDIGYQFFNTETGRLRVWSGTAFTSPDGRLTATATYDPPALTDGAGVSTTVAVPGAFAGMIAEAAFSNSLQGIIVTSYATTDLVTVRFQNETGGTIDLGSGTLTVSARRV